MAKSICSIPTSLSRRRISSTCGSAASRSSGPSSTLAVDALHRDLEHGVDGDAIGAERAAELVHVDEAVDVVPVDQELDDDRRIDRVAADGEEVRMFSSTLSNSAGLTFIIRA